MALIRINDNPSNRELRQFAGIWFPIFWVLVAGLLSRAGASALIVAAVAAFGLFVGGVGVFRPSFIRPIYLLWMYAAFPVGWTVSHVLLASIFFLIVTPIGLAIRHFGHDPMTRVRRPRDSYWMPYDGAAAKTDYFRQY